MHLNATEKKKSKHKIGIVVNETNNEKENTKKCTRTLFNLKLKRPFLCFYVDVNLQQDKQLQRMCNRKKAINLLHTNLNKWQRAGDKNHSSVKTFNVLNARKKRNE